MTVRKIIQDRPVLFLYGLMAVTLLVLLLFPPLRQDQDYHHFADQRELFGIPHFWNVVSNVPFILVGAVGLKQFRRSAITCVLFGGILLTGFGSAYYHLDPNDHTLFWDRLPMTLCFVAILCAVVEERVDTQTDALLLWPLLIVGIFSLLLWQWTGDLRLYVWVQFFPFIVLALVLGLFPPKYSGARYWGVGAALYALAKLFEYFDRQIFDLGGILSGHTLKHLAAAAACFAVLRLFQVRRPLADAAQASASHLL